MKQETLTLDGTLITMMPNFTEEELDDFLLEEHDLSTTDLSEELSKTKELV